MRTARNIISLKRLVSFNTNGMIETKNYFIGAMIMGVILSEL